MQSINTGSNVNKGLNSTEPIILDDEFFKTNPFYIPKTVITSNTNNTIFFETIAGGSKIEISFDNTSSKYTVNNVDNVTLSPSDKTTFDDQEKLLIDDTYPLIFDTTNGIFDGRNKRQLDETKISGLDKDKYKNSIKAINKAVIPDTGIMNFDAHIFDFIKTKGTNKDKLKEINNTINNLFTSEANKDKLKIPDINMSDIFDESMEFDENSIFKDAKNLQVFKGGDDFTTNSFTAADFFGDINTYRDTDFNNKLKNGTNKASYGLLSNNEDKMRINMGSSNIDIEKTTDGYKIGDKTFNDGDRYQENGYTIEFKDGYVVNSVKDNELEMLQNFQNIDKTHLSSMMNCMSHQGDAEVKNDFNIDDYIDNFQKSGSNEIDDISLNKFRKKMIDVIFDTPENSNIESFLANNETFLKLDKTNLPTELQNKSKSHVYKNKFEVDTTIKDKVTDEFNVYLATEAGKVDKDEVKFVFNTEKLKIKHEIDDTDVNNKKDKYTFTDENGANTAQASGFNIKKYDKNSDSYLDETNNVFHKDDLLEIEKNNLKYVVQMGSTHIHNIVDSGAFLMYLLLLLV